MTSTIWPWIVFTVFVLGMLALDLGVFHRDAHVVTKKEAALWSLVWILLALIFNAGLYYVSGPVRALEFLTGYLIEYSLSVDNIFVFIVIFSYFVVPEAYRHRVLFWGILGALLMRGLFIAVGAALLQHFHWVIYLFGAFLVLTGIKLLLKEETAVHPEDNPVIKLLRRLMPITERYEGQRFFVTRQEQRFATPLLAVLVTVESTDLIFAVDSVPAIFAVTTDPFIVYTSNVFAILGLRALYFLLAGVMGLFCYLRYGLGSVLGFVGMKMMLADVYKISIGVSLGVIAALLTLSILASLLFPRKSSEAELGVITSLEELRSTATSKDLH
ncbi:MAG: TerC family protein [Deltaproteobacteria bacterium]|nr:TerC family protein [Deltaproteobacteria bacterium]